jgi:hypothetical protein
MRPSVQKNISKAGKVFTVVDAGMTAGFGWLASSLFVMKPVLAGGLGALSYTLAFLPAVALACYVRGWRPFAFIIMAIYAGGFFGNFFSNYGLSAAIFKGNVIQAQNKNLAHEDARTKVKRLRAELKGYQAVIDAPGPWMTSKDAQAALNRTVAAKEREGNRVRCGPKCEALDARARDLQLELGKAKAREDAIAGRKRVQGLLKAAEAEAGDKPKEISVAAAQAEYLARIFSLDLKPDGDTVDWTLMGTSVAISLFISIFAHLCNLIAALNLANIPDKQEPEDGGPLNTFASREWIAPPKEYAPREVYRSGATTATASHGPGGTMNVSVNSNNMDEAMQHLDAVLERLQARRGAA